MSEHHTALIVRVQVAAQALLPVALFGGLWLVARALDSGLDNLVRVLASK